MEEGMCEEKAAEIEICICKKGGYLCSSNQNPPVSQCPFCFRKSLSEILVYQV